MSLRHAPLAAALAPPLLAALRRVLPARPRVLELGSGTGQLAAYAAARWPELTWQPSDPDPESRASIAAWTASAALTNVAPPLALDLFAPAWRLQAADAVVAVNVLHVAGEGAAEALVDGAAAALPRGGRLVVAGPTAAPFGAWLEAVRRCASAGPLVVVEESLISPGVRLVVLAP